MNLWPRRKRGEGVVAQLAPEFATPVSVPLRTAEEIRAEKALEVGSPEVTAPPQEAGPDFKGPSSPLARAMLKSSTSELLAAAAETRLVVEVEEHQAPPSQARADFNCAKCQAVHVSLPANSTRCPVTGFKRGFVRLYDQVQVYTSGQYSRKATKFIDGQLEPAFAQKAARDEQARRFEKEIDTAHDKGWELSTGDHREAYVKQTGSRQPMRGFGGLPGGGGSPSSRAAASLGAFPHAARVESARTNFSHLTQLKTIRPKWVGTKSQ